MIPAESLDKATRERRSDDDARAVDLAWDDVRRFVIDGIEAIGGSEVAAGIVGIDRSDLRKAINETAGRGLWVRHVLQLGRRFGRVNPSLVTRLGAALVDAFDLQVFPRVTLTDKERADRLEAAMRSMPLGDQLVEHALGGRR